VIADVFFFYKNFLRELPLSGDCQSPLHSLATGPILRLALLSP